jgi:HNH endonuclease
MTEATEPQPPVKVHRGDPCAATPDCGKPVAGRGWCAKHYATWQKHGDPLHKMRRYVPQGPECADEDCHRKPKRRGFCEMHARREELHGETTDPRERRFWSKVDKNGPPPETRPELGPCWIYTGYVDPKTGYGQFGNKGTKLPHRIAYRYVVGPIPKGMHLDHLCRRRICCRPDHLEPVTPRENIRRGDQGAFWGYIPEPIPVKPVQLALAVCRNGCAKPLYKRDLCRPCYRKWLKDPNVERPSKRTPEQRFWAKVNKRGPVPQHVPELGRCWVWTASVNVGTGYGQFARRHGKGIDAHRFSYELANGPVPENLDVHHKCHLRHCVRPSHLDALTRAENTRLRKYRRNPAA